MKVVCFECHDYVEAEDMAVLGGDYGVCQDCIADGDLGEDEAGSLEISAEFWDEV